jgi:carbohydrate kinase (thermoresistant glucokinase family)
MIIVLMGVSGCGKTTVGQILADKLKVPFYDADDFHPAENVEKMNKGIPLTDDDRDPWLNRLSANIMKWNKTGDAVLACSALKKKYREYLDTENAEVIFVYLQGSKELILNRMKKRKDHYMPVSLLDSQFDVLEEPKNAITVSIEEAPSDIANEIINLLPASAR